MVSQRVRIKNPTGLHLRPASNFCELAAKYKSRITFNYGRDKASVANAKSLLSILGACVKLGDEIIINCDGIDEQEALDAMVRGVDGGLGE